MENSIERGVAGEVPDTASSSPQPAQEAPHPSAPGLPSPSSSDAEEADFSIPEPEPAYQKASEESPELSAVKEGDLCQGEVVGVSPDGVFVDIGRKTEGIVPLSDFAEAGPPSPGDAIDVIVTGLGNLGEHATLSYQSAQRRIIWGRIESAYRETAVMTGTVAGQVNGGLAVDLGVHAFLPVSHVDIKPPGDLERLVGQSIDVRIVKFNKAKGDVVVSRRVLLEAELLRLKRETLAKLSEGAVVSGTVKNLTSYGAFIDLGGLDGLLHVTDISYSRVKQPSDVIKVGDSISAKVLKFDPEREKVSLSLKALEPDPWEGAEERYQQGQRVKGRVVSSTEYGVFIELEKGLEGLIHSSEVSWSRHAKRQSKGLKIGREVECLVVKVDREARRVSLSIKQLEPDPWITAVERYPMGTVIEGRVLNLVPYGAFVEVEEGIDGFVHLSDLTRDTKVRHPKDLLKKGQNTRAAVLRVDTKERRIALGLKQLEPDAWDTFFGLYLVGDIITGRVTSQAKYGVFVDLAPGVEALCHSSEMRSNAGQKSKGALRVGQSYSFKITGLSEFEKRIRLSRRGVPNQAPESKGAENSAGAAKPDDDANRADGAQGPAKRRRRKRTRPSARAKELAPATVADHAEGGDPTAATIAQGEGPEGQGGDASVATAMDSTAALLTSAALVTSDDAVPEANRPAESSASVQAVVPEASDGKSAVDVGVPAEETHGQPAPIDAESATEQPPETGTVEVDAAPGAQEPSK
jgi:small subunit ribosomal protein S1